MAGREAQMPKAYDPREVEQRLYTMWVERGYFTPKIDWGRQPFTIIMPPPNVTGALHVGHALTATLEDIMVRWHRMRGEPALWLPGSDHAGISTQVVVERELAKEGKSRHDLGRERFLERVWQWVERYGETIDRQHMRLGASADWTRKRFTMDPGPSRAVRTHFVRLYHKGRIYRGERMVNWCPRCETVLSDLEVDYVEHEAKLYFVRYPLFEGQEGAAPRDITVATTRPETMLGDTAVAVNPNDERYIGYIGGSAVLPAVGRIIPIVADAAVDPEFGTGAVKVTPGHDPADFEIGGRHNLPTVNILNKDGTLNENAGKYAGLDRFVARQRLLEELERDGLLVRAEDHRHSVAHCERCRTVLEPIVSRQWFIDIQPLAQPAIEAVRDGRIRIVPERFTRVYLHWMENIRDWCISRQLWWGHRIPVWYCDDCPALTLPSLADPMADPTFCSGCGGQRIHQDPDVLDTWFSSALWPHSTLGWPDDTDDLRYFYPTSVMETAYDILFFWVARMIMIGIENVGDVPFRTVYLHGLVRDEKGEKMSKSKGNVIDPLEVMEQYGTDALRFALATGSTPGNDMKLSFQRIEAARNFANKLWNVARYVLMAVAAPEGGADAETVGRMDSATGPLEDRWILSRLNRLVASVDQLLGDYQFGEAGRQIHDFLWGELADWYVEIAKIRLRRGQGPSPIPVLLHVLDAGLRLLHPFMPFVTEEIWQNVQVGADLGVGAEPAHGDLAPSLVIAEYPRVDASQFDDGAEREMGLLMDIVRTIRNARAEFGVEAARSVDAIVVAGPDRLLVERHRDLIAQLPGARVAELTVLETMAEKPRQAASAIVGTVEVYLPLAGMVDVAAERARTEKEIDASRQEIARIDAKLANRSYVERAPAEVVDRDRERLAMARAKLAKLLERRAVLE